MKRSKDQAQRQLIRLVRGTVAALEKKLIDVIEESDFDFGGSYPVDLVLEASIPGISATRFIAGLRFPEGKPVFALLTKGTSASAPEVKWAPYFWSGDSLKKLDSAVAEIKAAGPVRGSVLPITLPVSSQILEAVRPYLQHTAVCSRYQEIGGESRCVCGLEEWSSLADKFLQVLAAGPAPAARAATAAPERPIHRERLPDERKSITHHFSVGGHEGYITIGFYPDGRPGEVYLCMAKEGSTLAGFMDGVAILISILLQHGVPLAAIVDKLKGTSFEPSGVTTNSKVPMATSIFDYLGRWLESRFLPKEDGELGYEGPKQE